MPKQLVYLPGFYWIFILPDRAWKIAYWQTVDPEDPEDPHTFPLAGHFVLCDARDDIPFQDVVLVRGPLKVPE